MINKDSRNGMFISSSNGSSKDEDLFVPKDNEQREDKKQEFLQAQTQSQLSSSELIGDVPVPRLTLFVSQMSLDENQGYYKKQMSLEALSPTKYSPQQKQENQIRQDAQEIKQLEIQEIKQVDIQEVQNVQQIQTRRKVNKANYNVDNSPVEEDEMKPCHCTKTHCLQLYCSCFHNRRQCMSECKCNDCYNDGQHEEDVLKAVEQIKMKEQRASHHDLDSFDTKQVWGCKCKNKMCKRGKSALHIVSVQNVKTKDNHKRNRKIINKAIRLTKDKEKHQFNFDIFNFIIEIEKFSLCKYKTHMYSKIIIKYSLQIGIALTSKSLLLNSAIIFWIIIFLQGCSFWSKHPRVLTLYISSSFNLNPFGLFLFNS